MCKSWCEAVLAIIAIVVGLLPVSEMVYKWVLIAVVLVLLIHSLTCKKCFSGSEMKVLVKTRKK